MNSLIFIIDETDLRILIDINIIHHHDFENKEPL